jgi:hypothetical protein
LPPCPNFPPLRAQCRPMCSCYRGVSLSTDMPLPQRARPWEMPSGNRPIEKTHLDCPHRPAPRCGPELLPVPRAAEFLSRSTCSSRFESFATPLAASSQRRILPRFGHWGNRPGVNVCRNDSLDRRCESGFCHLDEYLDEQSGSIRRWESSRAYPFLRFPFP